MSLQRKISNRSEEWLYRHIHPNMWSKKYNRPSSSIFKTRKNEDGLSVHRDGGRTKEMVVEYILQNNPSYAISRIITREVISLDLVVYDDPTAENPYHSLISGKNADGISDELAEELFERFTVVVKPKF
jgi:hypothetical protein